VSVKSSPARKVADYRRRAVATRRLGKQLRCSRCGEARPEALIPTSEPRICAACGRKSQGKIEIDFHHVAGRNNHRATVPVPVNDHRALLNVDQFDWPAETLRNPDRSPLLAIAASIRGFINFVEYCVDTFLRWIPSALETLAVDLDRKLGPGWWKGTEIEKQVTQETHSNETT
jgi:hypothetical protein